MAAQPASAGVEVEDVVVGTGAGFSSGNPVKLHYTLTLGGWESDGGRVVVSSSVFYCLAHQRSSD